MKIVMISDNHNWEIKDIPEGDILIHAGDATGEGTIPEMKKFFRWYGAVPGFKHKIFVPGNHDWLCESHPGLAKEMAEENGIIYLNNDSATIEGLNFWGSAYTPWFYGWAFNIRGNAIERYWEMIPDDTHILITHGPPFMIRDRTIRGQHVGDPLLMKHIRRLGRLKLHVFGHIHWSNGVDERDGTYFVNAAICDEQYKPTQKINVVEI